MKRLMLLVGWMMLSGCDAGQGDATPQLADRTESETPNFLLIVADDLGYTDLGAFGGEIDTPNLDQLALQGIRLTDFHTSASCAPTRAMLLTGNDNHVVGMGSQGSLVTTAQAQLPQYSNSLLPDHPTIAELLGEAGYRTYAAAKWHVGSTPASLPGARGFDRSFVLLEGGAGHFDDTPLFAHYEASWLEDDQRITLPREFYSSDELTQRLINYIDTDQAQHKPFFAYLGFTAPHWPLQAPPEDINKYADRYLDGWDQLRLQRMQGARQSGVVPPDASAVDFEAGMQPWDELDLSQQALEARTMAVYSAMVDRLDQNVGHLLDYLRQSQVLDNTVIIFLSDNGAEAHRMEEPANRDGWIEQNFDDDLSAIGTAASYVTLGPAWARATAVPFRASKSKMSEGGTRVPAFVSLPQHRRVEAAGSGTIDASYHRVMDLLPSLLHAAGLTIPASVRGKSQWSRWLGGSAVYQDTTVAAELYGRRMARRGDWKILLQEAPYGTGEWQLYNLAEDLGEQHDLSAQYPQVRTELIQAWQRYAQEVGVLLPEHPISY